MRTINGHRHQYRDAAKFWPATWLTLTTHNKIMFILAWFTQMYASSQSRKNKLFYKDDRCSCPRVRPLIVIIITITPGVWHWGTIVNWRMTSTTSRSRFTTTDSLASEVDTPEAAGLKLIAVLFFTAVVIGGFSLSLFIGKPKHTRETYHSATVYL